MAREEHTVVLDAARRWKERCLLGDGSILSDRPLWTLANFDQLDKHYVQNLKLGKGTFASKLKTQLSGAPAEAKQLAAEAFWLMFLFVWQGAMGAVTKRLQIKEVWEWSDVPLPTSDMLGAPLERGIGHPGRAYNTYRWLELVFLIDAMRAWKRQATSEQQKLANDGWAFATWLETIPSSRNRLLREVLLYLLFPTEFEHMATKQDKQKAVREFLKKEGKDPDTFNYDDRIGLDREVKRIREDWAQTFGEGFDFYQGAAKDAWKPSATSTIAPGQDLQSSSSESDAWFAKKFGNHRVWVIAAGPGGRWWPDFQKEGMIAIGWDDLGDLRAYRDRESIRSAMKEQWKIEHDPMHDSLAAWNFSHEMRPGDHVFAKKGLRKLLGHGVITSEYVYDEERAEAQHIRHVDWKKSGQWELPETDRIAGKTLTDFVKYKDWVQMAWDLVYGKATEPASRQPAEAYSIDHAMVDVFMARDTFQRILDVLAEKKNVILEGAPGVGKTFVARRIAWALMQSRDNARLEMVQFHQSYAYEDFVQGWRPDRKGFRLQNGVFHRFCERARKDSERSYVFIIDEINRGNLSKVLGELMMLIEADKRGDEFAIPLTYSQSDDERFSVPDNVHIVGLMNTADRSLAMVDYALRRRFAFFRLEPAFESEIFADVLEKRGVPEELIGRIRKAMASLNKEISEDRTALGPGFEVGHSFFVPTDGTDALDEIWYVSVIRGEIEPLLREYWFDQPDRVTVAVKSLLG
jgi:MoxR-like ATPase